MANIYVSFDLVAALVVALLMASWLYRFISKWEFETEPTPEMLAIGKCNILAIAMYALFYNDAYVPLLWAITVLAVVSASYFVLCLARFVLFSDKAR